MKEHLGYIKDGFILLIVAGILTVIFNWIWMAILGVSITTVVSRGMGILLGYAILWIIIYIAVVSYIYGRVAHWVIK